MVAVELIYNLALLVALSAVSGFIQSREAPLRRTELFQGLLFGTVAIIGMLRPLVIEPGVLFDGRSVVISLCGFFFGPAAVSISMVMAMICRVLQGGGGALTGVLVILSSGGIGLAFHYLLRPGTREPGALHLLGLGLLVHVVMVLLLLTLPVINVAGLVLGRLALPMLLTYPLATVLIGKILSDQQSRRRYMKELWATNEEIETTLYSIGDAVICTDTHARVQRMNEVAERLTGWTEEEAQGRALEEVFHIINEESGEIVESPARQVLANGMVVGLANHTLLVARDGTQRPIADSGAPIRDAAGKLSGVVLVFRDQTEAREAEKALRANEIRYRTLFTITPHPMWVYDRKTLAFLEVNEAAIEQYGYSREEFLAMTIADIRPPGDLERLRAAVVNTPLDEVDHAGEWQHRHKDGSEVIVEIISHRIDFDGREAELVLAQDITERKHAESELRDRYEFEHLVSSLSGRFVGDFDVNPAITGALGDLGSTVGSDRAYLLLLHDHGTLIDNSHEWCAPGVPSGMGSLRNVPMDTLPWLKMQIEEGRVVQLMGPEALPPEAAAERSVLEEQGIKSLILWPILIGGEHAGYAGFDNVKESLAWSQRQVRSLEVFAGILSNALGRKRVEEALRDSEERFRRLLEEVPSIGVQGFDRDGMISYWNKGSENLYGYTAEEALGQCLCDLIVPPGRQKEARRIIQEIFDREAPPPPMELDFVRKDGAPVTVYTCHAAVRVPGKPVEVFAIDLDLSERKQAEEERKVLEEQFRQAQKMESIGRLAGGVAHDFNNMLSVILGHGELLRERFDPSSSEYDHIGEIMRAGERSSNLTRQLLAFARRQDIAPRVLDLNETAASTLKMLRRLIGENIELVWKPGENLWPLHMDPAQVDQVLTNLMINARDAITGAGRIVVETRNITLSEQECRHHHPSLDPGSYVVLIMSDTGAGISAETRERIFEPFFTTKEVGQGTGLGLATVYGIVKQNGGFINVYSEEGTGTTFRIYLPRHLSSDEEDTSQPAIQESRTGGETILLVEDEEALLTLSRVILERLGYTVLAFHNPREAVEAAASHDGPIDLLMTDVVMPGLSGREVWQRVSEARPQARCLFVSGYAAEVIAQYDLHEEGVAFLQKPFTMAALAEKLREALDGS